MPTSIATRAGNSEWARSMNNDIARLAKRPLGDLLNLHHRQIQSILAAAISEGGREKDMQRDELISRVRALQRAMDQLGWRMRF